MKTLLLALALMPAAGFAGSKYSYLPDPVLTPGVVYSTDTALVCEKDFPARTRKVTSSTKDRVYKNYHVDKKACTKGCKIDHLIPLSIGGANQAENLWPHEYGADWNVYSKTRLEVRLRKEVCTGKIPITEAQTCIQKDWTQCYQRFYSQETRNGHEDHQPPLH